MKCFCRQWRKCERTFKLEIIINNWGWQKLLKLHKYTLKLYNYAVLEYSISEGEQDVNDWERWQVGVENIWNCILMFVTLHSESCHFTLKWLQLCLPMVAFLHRFLQWSAWKPNIQHFSSSYWMSYILPPRILHSLRKPTTFLTRIHFILYENTLHSRKECSWFSYRA